MKLAYKEVGDTLTLDEYNALAYLLMTKLDVLEYVEFDGDTSYESNLFTMGVDMSNLEYDRGHFLYNIKSKKPVKFTMNTSLEGHLIVKLYYSTTVYVTDDNDKTVRYDPSDEYSDYESSGNGTHHCSVQSVTLTDEDNYSWTPSVSNGEVIVFDRFAITLRGPVINREDGASPDEEEILVGTFEELKRVIEESPPASSLMIRLEGSKTYKFNSEIYINNDKNVTIVGGNIYNDCYTILNANSNCRFFYINPNCNLTVTHCKFHYGNSYKNSPDTYDNGGAIYIASTYTNKNGQINASVGTLNASDCIFYKCLANRGGAIYNNRAKATLKNCRFHGCIAGDENGDTSGSKENVHIGGAIFNAELPDIYDATLQELQISSDTTCTYTKSEITLNLQFSTTQYTDILNTITLTKNNTTLLTWEDNTQITISSIKRINAYQYTITLYNETFTSPKMFYLIYREYDDSGTELTRVVSQRLIIQNMLDDDGTRTNTFKVTVAGVDTT